MTIKKNIHIIYVIGYRKSLVKHWLVSQVTEICGKKLGESM